MGIKRKHGHITSTIKRDSQFHDAVTDTGGIIKFVNKRRANDLLVFPPTLFQPVYTFVGKTDLRKWHNVYVKSLKLFGN